MYCDGFFHYFMHALHCLPLFQNAEVNNVHNSDNVKCSLLTVAPTLLLMLSSLTHNYLHHNTTHSEYEHNHLILTLKCVLMSALPTLLLNIVLTVCRNITSRPHSFHNRNLLLRFAYKCKINPAWKDSQIFWKPLQSMAWLILLQPKSM